MDWRIRFCGSGPPWGRGLGTPGAHAAKAPSPLEYIHMYNVSCMRWSILANAPVHFGECACPFYRMRLSILANVLFDSMFLSFRNNKIMLKIQPNGMFENVYTSENNIEKSDLQFSLVWMSNVIWKRLTLFRTHFWDRHPKLWTFNFHFLSFHYLSYFHISHFHYL